MVISYATGLILLTSKLIHSKNDTVFPSVTIQNFKEINYIQYIPSSDKFVIVKKLVHCHV